MLLEIGYASLAFDRRCDGLRGKDRLHENLQRRDEREGTNATEFDEFVIGVSVVATANNKDRMGHLGGCQRTNV